MRNRQRDGGLTGLGSSPLIPSPRFPLAAGSKYFAFNLDFLLCEAGVCPGCDQVMTIVLDLDSQIEHIDYSKKNFVHADLSPAEMMEAIKKRGDDGLTLALSIAADVLRQQNLVERGCRSCSRLCSLGGEPQCRPRDW